MGDTEVFRVETSTDFFQKFNTNEQEIAKRKKIIKKRRQQRNDSLGDLLTQVDQLKHEKNMMLADIEVIAEIDVGAKFLLSQVLKDQGKEVCMQGDTISDSFGLVEAKVGVT